MGHDRLMIQGRWLAAVLACGPGAVLSHRSAAALWEFRRAGAALIDVTVPSRNGRAGRVGVRVHRTRRLPPEEVTVRDGIPVTSVARTVLDLADVLETQALRSVIAEAEYTQRFDLTAFDAVVENNPGRSGARAQRAVGGDRTRSELEDRFLAFVDTWGVEPPRANVWIAGYEADFVWPHARLVVETDGLQAHGTRAAVKRDRRKDRALWRAGFRSMRLTFEDLEHDAAAVAEDLAQAGVSVRSRPRASSKSPSRSRISSASAR